MLLGQWFELAAGLNLLFDLVQMSCTIPVLSLLPHGNSCSSFLTFFDFFKDQLAGRLLKKNSRHVICGTRNLNMDREGHKGGCDEVNYADFFCK